MNREHLDRIAVALAEKMDEQVELPNNPSKRDRVLLGLIEEAWKKGLFKTDVDFRKWLDAIHVPSEFSTYT